MASRRGNAQPNLWRLLFEREIDQALAFFAARNEELTLYRTSQVFALEAIIK